MTGFVLLRVRAHRLLLAAALLAVLLTTSVLATLAAFSGSIGDAALQGTLQGRSAPAAALIVTGQVPADKRASAEAAVEAGARATFDGLPVTVRKLERSGPYALPRSLQAPAARAGDPDLTHFAGLDRSRVALVRGAWPKATGPRDAVEAALPEEAAKLLKVGPGTVLDLTDRLGGKPLKARITGLYRPLDLADLYWQLDPAAGRGVKSLVFTTYGPLVADPSVLASGRVTTGGTSWLGAADFTGITTDRMGALHAAAARGPERMAADTAPFGTTVSAYASLPTVLEQTDRALLVSRSTLSIVAVQLVLLAAYALLLVARLLSTERSGETELLRARGGSRRRIAGLAAVEALLLAVPAAIAAPLLSGPLTRLFADRSALDALGVRLDATAPPAVWLVAALVALCCAGAVVAPALAAGDGAAVSLRKGRAAALPAPVRAGADVGLLLIAGVAYWQLDRQTGEGSGGGALTGDRAGGLGIDPLLVAAPALALLAGTVLTLRLLPPAAKLAERRAAGGRGLPAALAGWQLSRRPLRGAGPVLLLVLAVAMGMLAIGQSASWDRSQRDQADFRTGATIRVLGAGPGDPAQTERIAAVPGVRKAASVHRSGTDVAGHLATVLAVDTRQAADGMLFRPDLTDGPAAKKLAALMPKAGPRPGIPLPAGARALRVDLRDTAPPGAPATRVTAVLEDRYGVPYRRLLGTLPGDGRSHRLGLPLAELGDPENFGLAGLEIGGQSLWGEGGGGHQLVVERLAVEKADGGEQPIGGTSVLTGWAGEYAAELGNGDTTSVPMSARPAANALATVYFHVATEHEGDTGGTKEYTLTLSAPRPAPPRTVPAIVTEAFLAASKAKRGDRVDVTFSGSTLSVRIAEVVRELPTTGPGARAISATAPAATPEDAGAILVDLSTANRALSVTPTASLPPTEWWLSTLPGRTAEVAETLRARPDADPALVLVRDEAAADLLGDPLGAGPNSALMAVAVAAAALAAVGFAVGSAGSLRERQAEFGLLRALGAPRRQLARLVAAEQGLLVGIGLLVGVALGTVLTRAVVPLIVLTGQAERPVPAVLVQLPVGHVALLLAGVSALPLAVVAAIALRRTDPAVTLRTQGEN
ncbi:ABC transporter permease [Streptomyces showdoensis]|uniref:Peptide ABC transporter permease n=1 Tax=Streptomyces showdoensis TaxID=68268 RepID=A0A2P2GRI8_STREW|nr:ABC transporter permease [Streptomyces showdoensis]KKZ74112.1 peptide ABC transporter permease [Streptomyces showdoensis]